MLYPKGMIVDIYRHSLVDCSLNGISKYTDKVLLVGEGVPPIFEADDRLPVIELRSFKGHIYAAPYACGNRSSAMGGNFIWSSDSRFPARAPIALHDRFEQRCHLDERYFRLATSAAAQLTYRVITNEATDIQQLIMRAQQSDAQTEAPNELIDREWYTMHKNYFRK